MTTQDNPPVEIELDDRRSPKTVESFLKNIPFKITLHVWGQEIYSSSSPIDVMEENPKSPVSLYDVAYWPSGRAICLFYGPTPIGKKGEIIPASPVNLIGKIVNPEKSILKKIEGHKATFEIKS